MSTATKQKYWSGQNCPKTAWYGQHSDINNAYAGKDYDRYVERNEKFPPSLNNHHFEEK